MKKKNLENLTPEPPYTGKLFAYIAIGLIAAGAVSLGLIFTVLGLYALIASILFEIGALSFVNIQKRKNDFKQLKIIQIAAYVALGITVAVFIGGIIYSALN